MRLLPVLLLLCGIALPALAQAPAAPASPAPAVSAAGLQPGEAQRLLSLLRDERRRAELARTLEALAAAEARIAPAPAAPGAGAPAAAPAEADAPARPEAPLLAPNTLGGQILIGASQRLAWLSDQAVAAAQAITDLPGLLSWFSSLAHDPVTQARVIDASWKLALLFGLGVWAEWVVQRALARQRVRLDRLAPRAAQGWRWLWRVPLVLGRLLLDLLPVAAFGLVSYGLIGAVRPLPTTELVLLTANNAYLACRLMMALSRMLLSPASRALRLLPCSDLTAAYVTLWLERITVVLVGGYAMAEAGLLLGLPWGAYDAILRLVLLVVSFFCGIIVLQNRVPVARFLRAPPLKPGDTPHRARAALRRLRDWLAEVWHVLAILYLLALWAVWALQIEEGFTRLLRASLLTLLVLAAAKGLDVGLRRVLAGSFRVAPDLAQRYPGLEARANHYLPLLKGGVSATLTVLTLLVLLEVWGISSFAWFAPGELGSRVVGSGISFALTVLAAVVVWEVANAALRRHLERLSRDAEAARSARVRTLLPMLRTSLLVVILLFVGFNLLTQIGVNVAPLLAGAGVVGLALGFGSQKLVQDVITGIFLLFEDAMAVGDVVTLGDKAGVVEQLSIRSIKLRDLDGSVHIIPFSTVTSVTNMTRDFSFALLDVQVSYRESTDRVVELLQGLCQEMRSEAKWSQAIRDELEVLGVDSLQTNGPVVRVRIKTEPIKRWEVKREMNRRIRQRFDELGIEIPAHRQQVVFTPAAPPPVGTAS
ncbi:mechanosensitive ion channel [Roseomonas sp. M0104]|uniref:Mechanosensitive ion channel n=1 Tax=Teichococcus coralli TaxID=2545983 RepID=A0A845BA20_9PROT|nr:mechanosensitive ion channel domain-containing protein [Pseudoroseomonas coralli]MXP63010.1 mechanosensitive ion channel [Pseudoroseomonas coralli]